MAPKIGKEEARFWDLMVKAIAGLIAIGTVWTGFQALSRQGEQMKIQQHQLEAQQRQFEATPEGANSGSRRGVPSPILGKETRLLRSIEIGDIHAYLNSRIFFVRSSSGTLA